jgi:hypothetical protein
MIKSKVAKLYKGLGDGLLQTVYSVTTDYIPHLNKVLTRFWTIVDLAGSEGIPTAHVAGVFSTG